MRSVIVPYLLFLRWFLRLRAEEEVAVSLLWAPTNLYAPRPVEADVFRFFRFPLIPSRLPIDAAGIDSVRAWQKA